MRNAMIPYVNNHMKILILLTIYSFLVNTNQNRVYKEEDLPISSRFVRIIVRKKYYHRGNDVLSLICTAICFLLTFVGKFMTFLKFI